MDPRNIFKISCDVIYILKLTGSGHKSADSTALPARSNKLISFFCFCSVSLAVIWKRSCAQKRSEHTGATGASESQLSQARKPTECRPCSKQSRVPSHISKRPWAPQRPPQIASLVPGHLSYRKLIIPSRTAKHANH